MPNLSHTPGPPSPSAEAFPELGQLRAAARHRPWLAWLGGTTAGAGTWVGLAAFVLAAVVGLIRGWPRAVVHDELSYLFAGELYAQGRWSAPPPPEPEFFETFHELMTPRRASKYPIAQGLVLALGYRLGHPIIGLWIVSGLLAAALVWTLRAHLPLRWAVAGALAGVGLFGGTTYWAQSYWGFAIAALGGTLVWGSLRRLCARPTVGVSATIGLGVVVLMHSRPFEGALFCVVPAWLLAARTWRAWRNHEQRWPLARALGPATAITLVGFVLLAWVNASVTGSVWRLPYAAYDDRYHSIAPFIWNRARPAPAEMPERMLRYDEELVVPLAHWPRPVLGVWSRRALQVGAFYLGPALALAAVAALLPGLDRWRRRALATTAVCWASCVISFLFQERYQAPAVATVLLLGIGGLYRLTRTVAPTRRRALLLLFASGHLAWIAFGPDFGAPNPAIVAAFDRLEEAKATIENEPGPHLIFVAYDRDTTLHAEFVYNAVDLAAAPIIWAHDLGADNARLLPHFPGRKLWRMRVSPTEVALQPLTAVPASPAP